MKEIEFNLLTEPWVRVRRPDNTVQEVSLTDALLHAQDYAAMLNGEMIESKNKLRLFPLYAGQSKERLSYPQAARWLLSVNGFDDTSLKPKEKNLPSISVGWLGSLGYIQALGNNLYETLMLNLTLLKDGREYWSENRPCWELETPRSAERTKIPCPDDPAQLLTLQSRRLLLHRTEEMVDGYFALGGDFFSKENAFAEQMTVWRNAAKKNEPAVFVPCRHDPARQFWREFPAVFCQDSGHRPGVVRWTEKLQEQRLGILDSRRKVHFRIVGVLYATQNHIEDIFSDSLTFQAGLLDELSCEWQERIVREINNCEKAAQCVGYLAQDIAIAAGNAALKGHRIVVDKGKKTERTILYTAPRAYNIFRAKLWEIYPKAES